MEIATAKIKIKDHKEEINKIIDDTYLRPSYKVRKLEEGVYEGHSGIIGVFGMRILKILNKKNLLPFVDSFVAYENIEGLIEEKNLLDGYKEKYNIH